MRESEAKRRSIKEEKGRLPAKAPNLSRRERCADKQGRAPPAKSARLSDIGHRLPRGGRREVVRAKRGAVE